ncbi:MAG: DNA topoisomerase IV subunit A [Rhodobacteraceae bacterium]|nr:MAG: DNA topoisomerase IV subunit A [Paracoccaceae bacterium]
MNRMNDKNSNFEKPIPFITTEPLSRAIGERYLQYALSTIMHRALPDARDGLKPVHRRILYAMRELKLAANSGFRKSAKISGDVMGNYHPHGDAAIYDAMARLAQDFNVRYPLVDGQGNFGNIDGDNPAASRYTEARLTKIAQSLMEGLSENAVDFQENYDGTLTEPIVFPASFPNLLANGASGIAVGMATNIPPHNLDELISACIHLVKAPNARDETLMDYIPGPDFPTGGIIVEPYDNILDAYRTGRGSFRLRSKWIEEKLDRGQWQIVISEIPYQVQKSKLIEKIAELINNKKIPILADVRDESTDEIRIILEPRTKMIDPSILMETLFKQTDLETRFSLNLNVLIDGRTPKVCSLKEVLNSFLQHQKDVLIRRSKFNLKKIDHRLEVLEGYIVAFLNLDRVIEIIRNENDPKLTLITEFELSDTQAEAILNMRLRSLRKLEEIELRKEHEGLLIERANLEDLLNDETIQWKKISSQLRETQKLFGKNNENGKRRSEFAEAIEFEDVPIEAMIEREPITIVCSEMSWIRAMKGHIDLKQELKFRDGDTDKFLFHAESTDKISIFATNGRFYTLSCSQLPGGRGMGEPLRLMLDIPNDVDIVDVFVTKENRKFLVASSKGDGFIISETETNAQTKNGKQILNLKDGAKAIVCKTLNGDHIACIGENRKMLIFPISDLPEMTRGKGVRMQKYKDGGLSDASTFNISSGLSWRDPADRQRTETKLEDWISKRASSGRMAPRGFPRDNKFN